MPGTTQIDYQALAQDAAFKGMTPAQRTAYLSDVDPSFAKMSAPDQQGYLSHLLGETATPRVESPADVIARGGSPEEVSAAASAEALGQARHATLVVKGKPGLFTEGAPRPGSPAARSEAAAEPEAPGSGMKRAEAMSEEAFPSGGPEVPGNGLKLSEARGILRTGPAENVISAATNLIPGATGLKGAAAGAGVGAGLGIEQSYAGGAPLVSWDTVEHALLGAGLGAATPALLEGLNKVGLIGAKPSDVIQTASGPISRRARNLFGLELTPKEAKELPPGADFQPALYNTPEEVLQHAQKEGVQLTPGQATGATTARVLQAEGERSLFGQNQLVNAINQQRSNLLSSTSKFAQRLDPHNLGMTDETAGEAIQKSAQTALSVAKDNANQAYEQVRINQEDLAGDISSLKDFATNQLEKRQPHAALTRPVYQSPATRAALADIADAPDRLGASPSIESLRNLRTEFYEKAHDYSGNIPDNARRMYAQAEQIVDREIMNGAKGTPFEENFRDASAQWAAIKDKYDDPQSPLYRILQQRDPARVTQSLLTRASAADVRLMRQEGMQPALDAMKRRVVEDVARNNFRVGAGGLAGYPDNFLRELFGGQDLKQLYLTADLGRRMRFEINPSGTSNVLLGNEQLLNPASKSAFIPFGASRYSMPRPAGSFLPEGNVPLSSLRNVTPPEAGPAPPGTLSKLSGFKPKAFAGGPESGMVPLKSLIGKAEKIFPQVKEPGERNFILPSGKYLSADDNDHFMVENLYRDKSGELTVGDEDAINKFLTDTGAVRTRFDGENFLVHLGPKNPTGEQLSGIVRSFRDHEPSITGSVQVARFTGKGWNQKNLPSTTRGGELRREIENLYK